MTHIAKCCQPIPGDEIVGYITQGRGISIHRQGCLQYAELSNRQPERVIDAVWGDDFTGGYRVTLVVHASDRSGLLREFTVRSGLLREFKYGVKRERHGPVDTVAVGKSSTTIAHQSVS